MLDAVVSVSQVVDREPLLRRHVPAVGQRQHLGPLEHAAPARQVDAERGVLEAPRQQGRDPGDALQKGDAISSGIMLLMYRFGRPVALVYIRQPQRHRGGAQRRVGAP